LFNITSSTGQYFSAIFDFQEIICDLLRLKLEKLYYFFALFTDLWAIFYGLFYSKPSLPADSSRSDLTEVEAEKNDKNQRY
jgi:hypothetical protein